MQATRVRSGSTVIAMALLSSVALPAAGVGQAARPDSADAVAVEAVVNDFHAALAAGDSARALELLHPGVRVFEGGRSETLSEYRSGHLAADMEFSAAVDRNILSEDVAGRGDLALYLSQYRMRGRFRGEELEVSGTETMVLLHDVGRWRIRHIHWSSR